MQLVHTASVLETNCYISIQVAIHDFRDRTGWFELPADVVDLVIEEMDKYSPKLARVEKTALAIICVAIALILLAKPYTDLSQQTGLQKEPVKEELNNQY